MTTVAEARLWGTTIGAVSLESDDDIASFEYTTAFAASGIQLSPLHMPLSRQVYRFPALPRPAFHGLPGLLADSLPDRFGNALIDAWLARQGRTSDSFNAVERLCYIGSRGMGGLEFLPALGPKGDASQQLDIARLVELASEILGKRHLQVSFAPDRTEDGLRQILQVGTSAGGARAKAVIAWNPQTGEVRSGQLSVPPGFEHWLLKFDGVRSNRDKELDDPRGYGAIEYAYALMATDAGIAMNPCRLLEENGRHHFMTRRFDRTWTGDKLHMQSLAALAHFDYNAPGAHSYEEAFMVARRLGLGIDSVEELFRRMVFNVIARNQDDHVKNTAFLMNRRGEWSLAPAFDITFSYQPTGRWTGSHQMTLNGRRDDFEPTDIKAAGAAAGLKRGRAEAVAREIRDTVARWPEYAATAGVSQSQWRPIQQAHRLYLAP